jgi:hypothetical protein
MTPTLNSIVTTPLQQKIPVMYPSSDLTPLALMTIDPFLLWVNPTKYKSWAEFEKACKAGRLTSVGTGARQEDEIQIGLIQVGRGLPAVPLRSRQGRRRRGHRRGRRTYQDFNVNQPAEALPHYPERLIPIVAFAKKRFEAFKDVTHALGAQDRHRQQQRVRHADGHGDRTAPDARPRRPARTLGRSAQVARGPVAQGARDAGVAGFHEEDGPDADLHGRRRIQEVDGNVREQPRPHDAGRVQVEAARRPQAALI